MTLFLDICKVIGACSVVAVFGAVLYALALEAWGAWKSFHATKQGLKRLQEIAEQSMAELRQERQLEALYKLPSREPRRRAL